MEDFGELISNLTENAKASLVTADLWSQLTNSSYIGTEHILIGILSQTEAIATKFLADSGVTLDKVRDLLGVKSDIQPDNFTAVKVLSESARLSLGMGWSIAREYNQTYLGTEHILFAILEQTNSQAHALLLKLNADIEALRDNLRKYFDRQLLELARSELNGRKFVMRERKIAHNSVLQRYSTNLTRLAAENKLDPVVGREIEIERLVTVLSRRTKSNPVLVGEPGVGKSAIVEGLAQRIVAGAAPTNLLDCQIVELDLTGLVAGTKFRGEFEDRLHKIVMELKANRHVIVFLDELHLLVGAGSSEGSIDAANILKPALARGQIRLIGATTFDEYRRYIEKDAALARRLQPIDVREPSREQAIVMLKGISKKYAKHHQAEFDSEVIEAAVDLSMRYISERFLPDKAIDLIDEAAALVRVRGDYASEADRKNIKKRSLLLVKLGQAIETEDYQTAAEVKVELDKIDQVINRGKKHNNKQIKLTIDDVARAVSLKAGVPLAQIESDRRMKLANLDKILNRRVIGQAEAVEKVSNALRRAGSGITDGRRPIGSFVFMGPSGVGKTELARVLAEEVFGGRDSLLRIDMSEFSEKHSISGLLGAPAGYVGYDDEAKLTDAIRRRPYQVVLFDEIEKANQDIFNILLQILEEGYLTDSKGRTVDFTNTIIILTSNLGSDVLAKTDGLGFGKITKADDEAVMQAALNKFMRPELINRFDDVIVFNHLSKNDMSRIANLLIGDLKRRINKLGYGLKITPSLKTKLVNEALLAQSGARPLRRLIEDRLEQVIATAIIEGRVAKGDTLEFSVNRNGEIKMVSQNVESITAATNK